MSFKVLQYPHLNTGNLILSPHRVGGGGNLILFPILIPRNGTRPPGFTCLSKLPAFPSIYPISRQQAWWFFHSRRHSDSNPGRFYDITAFVTFLLSMRGNHASRIVFVKEGIIKSIWYLLIVIDDSFLLSGSLARFCPPCFIPLCVLRYN